MVSSPPAPPVSLDGHQPERVLALLHRRRAGGYRVGRDTDGARIGLVVEGGGMRGAISAAALDALWQTGFATCFDDVFGTSAGAINGAYFLSGQISLGTSIYYRNLTGKRFVNLRRWPEIMNIHYLFDHLVSGIKPLDTAAVMHSPTELHVSMTDVERGTVRYWHSHDAAPESLVPALRASASTPLLTAHQEVIDGHCYTDGLVHAGIPLDPARQQGCTHLVCLLTRPRGYRKRRGPAQAVLEWIQLRRYTREFRAAFARRAEKYNRCLDQIYRASDGPSILAIAPDPTDYSLKNSETRPAQLERAVSDSHRRTALLLGEDPATIHLYPEES